MEMVALALNGLSLILGLIALVCFVMVVVKMFQNDQMPLGIASIVLLPCCGIGGLLAFVMGWIKVGEWGLRNVMLIWTVIILINFVLGGIAFAIGAVGTTSSMTFQTVGQSIGTRP